jgi:hypothetical protein
VVTSVSLSAHEINMWLISLTIWSFRPTVPSLNSRCCQSHQEKYTRLSSAFKSLESCPLSATSCAIKSSILFGAFLGLLTWFVSICSSESSTFLYS